jgi:menaquinone-9 beta-reductase
VRSFDVAIIGAGPAGSTLAALLAGRGVRVALIDRERFPRDKVCGEFLSWDALPLLDRLGITVSLDDAAAPRIEQGRIVGRRRTYAFPFPHPARGISRMLLDHLLLRTAEARGATRLDGWNASALDKGAVTIESDEGEDIVEATVIVGAWGRWGRFDQQLGRRFVRDRVHRSFGFKRHYMKIGERLLVPSSIDLYSFRGGYLGVNDVEGDATNICGLVHASRLAGHKGRWEAFIPLLRNEEPRLDELYASHRPAQQEYLTSEPVIFRARSAVERGVFMIGDASGIIDPLTGNGMAMAVQSALIAAPPIMGVLANPFSRAQAEREYCARHGEFFSRRIAWSRSAARLMSRPRLLDAALATLSRTRIAELFMMRTRASRDEVSRLSDSWFC